MVQGNWKTLLIGFRGYVMALDVRIHSTWGCDVSRLVKGSGFKVKGSGLRVEG